MHSAARLSAIGCLVLCQAAQAGVDLQVHANHETLGAPLSVALADIDGDGIADVVSSAAGSSGVRIHFSASETTRDYSADRSFSALAIADLDANGTPDIAGLHYGADVVTVLLLDADGEEAGRHDLATGHSPSAIALGNLNADTYPDVVVANADDDLLSLFENDGAGGFDEPQTVMVGDHPVALAVEDFDSDGNVDVYVLNVASSTITPLLGDGNGSLDPQDEYVVPNDASFINGTSLPVAMAAGDVNGDDVPDLVTASMLGNTLRRHVNDGAGGLSDGGVLSLNWHQPGWIVSVDDTDTDIEFLVGDEVIAAFPNAMAIADVDQDGDPDLVVAAINRGAVTIFPGTATGVSGGVTFPLQSAAWSLALGNATGDEDRLDVAVAMPEAARVAVLENLYSTGWRPAAINNMVTIPECESSDGLLLGDDVDGESLTYEITAVESAGSLVTGDPYTGGGIFIGDAGDTDGASGISVSAGTVELSSIPQLAVDGLDPLDGTFTLVAGDTGNFFARYWNVRFVVTDAGGASSEGELYVTVEGDGESTCSIVLDGTSPIVVDGDGTVSLGEPGSEPPDESDDPGSDELAGGPSPPGEPVLDDASSETQGGGSSGWFLLLLVAAALRRDASA